MLALLLVSLVATTTGAPAAPTVATTVSAATQEPRWRPLQSWPFARAGQATAVDPISGRVFLFGALTDGNDVWEYRDGRFVEFAVTGARPSMRGLAALAFDPVRGRLVLFGGFGSTGVPFGDTWEFDPVASSWTELAPRTSPSARAMMSMVYDPVLGKVVLLGGRPRALDPSDETWTFDGADWALLNVAAAPPARQAYGMAFDPARDRTVVFGGFSRAGFFDDTWELDTSVPTWRQVPTATRPSARFDLALVYDPDRRRVVLHGGSTGPERLDDTWDFDGADWTPVPTSVRPPGRSRHSLMFDAARRVVAVFGGWNENLNRLDDLWSLDVPGGRWVALAESVPSSRTFARMAHDAARGRTVLFGGTSTAFGGLGDTWERSPSGWRPVSPPKSPPPRAAHAMVFDAHRGRVVMYGGIERGIEQLDTWDYDGVTWRQWPLAGSQPGRRWRHAMAYDKDRRRVILFGGRDGNRQSRSDTWEASAPATVWTFLRPATSPPRRYAHAMAYDARRQRVVLFGGLNIDAYGDTWEFDGTTWVEVTPATQSPTPRFDHTMVYDAFRGETVLFGGRDRDDQRFGDTWLWDGSDWRQAATDVAPAPRSEHAMAFEPARRTTVLFGGWSTRARRDSWGWGPLPNAAVTYHGSRCFSGSRTPILRAADGTGSWIGEDLALHCVGVAPEPAFPTFGVVGVSDTVFGRLRLPFPLGVAGCELRVSVDVVLPTARSGIVARLSLPIPDDPGLLLGRFHVQFLSAEPGVTPFGVVPSNAATFTIGAR